MRERERVCKRGREGGREGGKEGRREVLKYVGMEV